jgi:predicted enzyme related to lactoylglutathione lyase
MPRPIHFDVSAKDPERFMSFHEAVFDWKFEKTSMPMDYWLITTGPKETAGIDGGLSRGDPKVDPRPRKVNGQSVLAGVVLTLDVGDLNATLARVTKNGGKVAQPRGPIPGVGWYAAFIDPTGNAFGLMQADRKAR